MNLGVLTGLTSNPAEEGVGNLQNIRKRAFSRYSRVDTRHNHRMNLLRKLTRLNPTKKN